MEKVTKRQRSEISKLWFYSNLRMTRPNLVIQFTEGDNYNYFTIGAYSFNPITGVGHIDSVFNKLNYAETKELLLKN